MQYLVNKFIYRDSRTLPKCWYRNIDRKAKFCKYSSDNEKANEYNHKVVSSYTRYTCMTILNKNNIRRHCGNKIRITFS